MSVVYNLHLSVPSLESEITLPDSLSAFLHYWEQKISKRKNLKAKSKAAEIEVMKSHIEFEKDSEIDELKIMREPIELDKDVMKSPYLKWSEKMIADTDDYCDWK